MAIAIVFRLAIVKVGFVVRIAATSALEKLEGGLSFAIGGLYNSAEALEAGGFWAFLEAPPASRSLTCSLDEKLEHDRGHIDRRDLEERAVVQESLYV
jgi:hypothetical protein